MGGGTRHLALNEAEDGAPVFGRDKDGQVWTGPQTAKGPEQVNKGKVGPRVMWAQGFLAPRRMQVARTGPQVRRSSRRSLTEGEYEAGSISTADSLTLH